MKIEDQVVSLELSKKLKELKLPQESLWWWFRNIHKVVKEQDEWVLSLSGSKNIEHYSAFSCAELGEMLPKDYMEYYKGNKWIATLGVSSKVNGDTQADTEADSRAKMLIYLIENKLMEVK